MPMFYELTAEEWEMVKEFRGTFGETEPPRCPTCGARELAHCVGTKRGQVCEWEKRR